METPPHFKTSNKTMQAFLNLQTQILKLENSLNPTDTLRQLLTQSLEIVTANGVSLFIPDETARIFKNYICVNLDESYAETGFKLGEGIVGTAAQSAKIISRDDVAHPHLPPDTFGASIAIPLIQNKKVFGVLEFIRAKNEPSFDANANVWAQLLANQITIALQNLRLLKNIRQKSTHLETLNEINRIINATLDIDQTLKLITQKSVEIINAEAGSVFVVDDSGENLIFSVALGPAGMTLIGKQMPIDTASIAGITALNHQSLIINNVAEDPHWNTTFDKASEFKTRDILSIPMIVFDKVVGVIEAVNKKDGRPFTADDEKTLTGFARQAAIAMVNAQRFSQIDRALADRVKELSALERIDRDLNAVLESQEVAHLTLTKAAEALGASSGLIAMFNAEKSGLIFTDSINLAENYRQFENIPWQLTDGIIGKVASGGEAIMVNHGDNFAHADAPTSQLCVPFILRDEIIGVLSLERVLPHAFTADERAFAIRFASHAVLAIQNAKLFDAVKAANNAKSEFMNMTSHELKIPMTSIKGYTKMLMMVGGDSLNEQQLEFIRIIDTNVDRMNGLVMDLLDVSRIEAGRIRLQMENVPIADVVRDVTQSVKTLIEDKSQKLTLDVSPDLPTVWGDYNRLVQIVTNLVSNACKYTPNEGHIVIRADLKNDNLSLSVIDDGFGISEEDQTHLFEKFFRASDQNIRNVAGTGLGLAITRSLIALHNGEMWFTSELGKGSTFGFDLPIKK